MQASDDLLIIHLDVVQQMFYPVRGFEVHPSPSTCAAIFCCLLRR